MIVDNKIGLILKWLAVVVLFFVVVMPVQIIWFLIFPLVKIWSAKQMEKTDVSVPVDIMMPINKYGKMAKGFLEGAI
jgi:hypothetical protein